MKFRAKVELGGKTATGLAVPADVVSALGSSKRPAVRVTIGRHTYRTTIAPMGGRFMIPLSAENRAAAGVAAGDAVDIVVELDTEPRVLAVPSDLVEALGRVPAAQSAFAAMSYSNRQRHVLAVEGAKTAETRRRRIERVVEQMREVQG